MTRFRDTVNDRIKPIVRDGCESIVEKLQRIGISFIAVRCSYRWNFNCIQIDEEINAKVNFHVFFFNGQSNNTNFNTVGK